MKSLIRSRWRLGTSSAICHACQGCYRPACEPTRSFIRRNYCRYRAFVNLRSRNSRKGHEPCAESVAWCRTIHTMTQLPIGRRLQRATSSLSHPQHRSVSPHSWGISKRAHAAGAANLARSTDTAFRLLSVSNRVM